MRRAEVLGPFIARRNRFINIIIVCFTHLDDPFNFLSLIAPSRYQKVTCNFFARARGERNLRNNWFPSLGIIKTGLDHENLWGFSRLN